MDKRYEYAIVEKEICALWESLKPYAFDKESKKKVFSIDTPPPTVSGSLHIGHLFSYTQTDLVARYKRMRGFNVFYPMGFDDNGLPTERFVEKKHKLRGHMLKRSEFVALCLKESEVMAKVFADLWKRVGLSVDWDHVYSTISDRSRMVSQLSFLELYKKSLVYKKEEPALYCTTCRTTVAQAELDDAQVSTTFNDIVFVCEKEELVVATTRPELLPACVALFYHPDDNRYRDLQGKNAVTPIFGQKVPVLPDDSVDIEKGSGLVMCCTFGDQTDVMWYKKHNLPFVQVVGRNGVWTEAAGPLAGLRVHDARKKVLELLKESGLLREQKSISHNVSVHERCKQGIEYLVLHQWFVKILEHKDAFIRLADEIEWKPAFMKARYKDWVEHLGWDWCISRQRFYGVPFPVWYCADCNQVLVAHESDLPIDPQEEDYPGGACSHCSSTNIVPERDIMDTWNTSSLTPQINIDWPAEEKGLSLPMSLRPQAHDIIRTWTFYTIVKAFYHRKTIPWRNVAISGYVVAKGKEKISKSKGNAPTDPENLLKQYPADAIRYWAAGGRLGVDTQFSENEFRVGNRLLTKLWNAFRFCKDHIDKHDKTMGEPELDELNKWILHNLAETVRTYIKHFDAYEHTAALESASKFFWHIFCDNYLELIKDRIFNPDAYSEAVIAGTRYTLYECGFGILQLFAPFVPHVTEKLYQLLFLEKEGVGSLHVSLIDEGRFSFEFGAESELVDLVVDIVGQVRKLKSENNLSLKVALRMLTICCEDAAKLDALSSQEAILRGVTRAEALSFSAEVPQVLGLAQEGDLYSATVSVS